MNIACNQLEDMLYKKEKRKDYVLKKWEESKKLPRKKKKQRRKELQLEWDIYNMKLFGFGDEELFNILKGLRNLNRGV